MITISEEIDAEGESCETEEGGMCDYAFFDHEGIGAGWRCAKFPIFVTYNGAATFIKEWPALKADARVLRCPACLEASQPPLLSLVVEVEARGND